MKVSLHSAVMAGWCFAVVSLPISAIAGPPFRTDDPEPVDYTHWEFYTFTSGTHISGDTSGVGAAFEFNYGLIPNGQLHIVAPTAFDSPAGSPTLFGYGDTEIGFKYRFIEEEKDGSRPQVGIFPLVELPTGNQNNGLGAGHVSPVSRRAVSIPRACLAGGWRFGLASSVPSSAKLTSPLSKAASHSADSRRPL
jgi:hypothetical protein